MKWKQYILQCKIIHVIVQDQDGQNNNASLVLCCKYVFYLSINGNLLIIAVYFRKPSQICITISSRPYNWISSLLYLLYTLSIQSAPIILLNTFLSRKKLHVEINCPWFWLMCSDNYFYIIILTLVHLKVPERYEECLQIPSSVKKYLSTTPSKKDWTTL